MKTNVFKIIIAGDGGVGKTTLLYKYVNGTFVSDTTMTLGVQFHLKNASYGGENYSLQLWDLGGQDRFRFMLPFYIRGTRGAILLYDTTRMGTITTLHEWISICRSQDKNLPILLCGTKIDLVTKRSVMEDYARSFLNKMSLFDYVEVSAKTGENVEKTFEIICSKVKDYCSS
jgi:small GTP-binding protein